jgi:Flp pilus assembly protein TadD
MTQQRRREWAFAAACALSLAIVIGAYSNSVENAFHFDDGHVLVGNVYIRSLNNVPRFFTDGSTHSSKPANAGYRPLVSATLALDYWLGGGLNVPQFHRSQIAMQVVLGIAVFLLFLRLMNIAGANRWNRWAALFGATLYATHTTGTETLNLMHLRSELLSTLGVVGSFLVYLYLPRSRPAHLYLLPMIVGTFAKTPAVIFAPLFLVYLVLFEQHLSVREVFNPQRWPSLLMAFKKSLPALLVGAALFVFAEAMNPPTLQLGGGSTLEYLRTQVFMWLHYGRLFFVPVGLSADTDWTLIAHWYDTRVVAGLMFVALLLSGIAKFSATPAQRPIAFGLAWFCLALLPASSIFPLAEVTNDHRPFFAYIGLSLSVAYWLASMFARWRETTPLFRRQIIAGAVVLAIAAIGGNGVGTHERNKVFLTDESFWRDVTEKSPANGRGLMNYGLTQMARARYAKAKTLFDRAKVHHPNYAVLEINLGIVTGRLGQPRVAESHFLKALQLAPNSPESHSFYARWLLEQRRSDEAIAHLQRAVTLSPAHIDARYQLLDAYANAGRTAESKALAMEILVLAPKDSRARRTLNGRGDTPVSMTETSGHLTAADLLDKSLRSYQSGDFQGSIEAARMALKLKRNYAEAHNNIAASLASLRQWDEAISEAHEALRLKPNFPLAKNNLLWAENEKMKSSGNSI